MKQNLAELINSLRLQATMFNDENNDFDVLVASDAIGMGLNLNISRIIFSTVRKFDGTEIRELTVSEIKQIAGKLFRRHMYLYFTKTEVTCNLMPCLRVVIVKSSHCVVFSMLDHIVATTCFTIRW